MASEKRLIDFEKARNAVMQILAGKVTTPIAVKVSMAIQEATVDAVEVVHGRWLLEREPDGKPYCFHCSVCDDDFHHISINTAYDYCPNCGAKMDGERKDK